MDDELSLSLSPPAVSRLAALVLLDGGGDLQFDYIIPAELADTVFVGSRVEVPLRHQPKPGTVLEIYELSPDDQRSLRRVIRTFGDRPQITRAVLKLGQWVSDYYCVPLHTVRRYMLPESIHSDKHRDKVRRIARLARPVTEEELEKMRKRAPRQAEIVEVLQQAVEKDEAVETSAFPSAPSLKALVRLGIARIDEEQIVRDAYADEDFIPTTPLSLNAEQQEALDVILRAVEAPREQKPVLLYGVTGSGKTEVYLQAAQKVIDSGRNVIILVPGISLTPQTVDRFRSRFATIQQEVAVLHSQLTQGERYDGWQMILRQKARVVIGTRNAVFAPLENLGLIIVDEEHESSYKQENELRYHARDVAVVRAMMEPCAIVLGSATPALESWYNASRGKYTMVSMTERADGAKLPIVRVVDMRLERKRSSKGEPSVLSEQLRIAISKRLDRGEQSILFLNRRGFAGSIQCQVCGHSVKCNHCSVSMTSHKELGRLVCHICGFQRIPPKVCPECNDPGILFAGFGTQRAEEVLRRVFPKARIARVDTDTMKEKSALRDTFNAFLARKLDIIIGTQMIARGLHFPGVTLVGILNADLSLNLPDFRASERTFSLLTQVAGRAGRGELFGEVVIQTFSPHAPAIQFSRHHDYEGFCEQEFEFRRQCGYPPFGHAVLITARGEHQRRTEFSLETLHKRLLENIPHEILMGDPIPSPLEKSHNQFRYQVLLRARLTKTMTEHIRKVLAATKLSHDVMITVDVDPVSLS